MNRRTFLKLPTLLPLVSLHPDSLDEYHFQYDGVIGTSMDLVVCTSEPRIAEWACQRVLKEIERLSLIFNARDPSSEISLLEANPGHKRSRELDEILEAYDYWERRTDGAFSIRAEGPNAPRNIDALGKAYIIDRASNAARKARPSIHGLLLNIGGDIVTWGREWKVAIADPSAWYDNARPITTISLHDAAVATSGTYARGAHLIHGRTGQPASGDAAATVVAYDAVTANALATTLCLTNPHEGFRLVGSTPAAEAIRIASGVLQRSSGFAFLERPLAAQAPSAASNWPAGYQLTLTLPLKPGRSKERPYVVVWVEDASGKLVRILALWGNKSKYYANLSTAFNFLWRNKDQVRSVTRATRPPGKYDLQWDGLDNERKPVPPGDYRITVETNQEHGTYAKQSGVITLRDSPTSITLPATTNFDEVVVKFGPR